MPNRLKDLEVEFISLVKSPANGLPLVLKQAGSRVFLLEKMDEERQVAYGIVYAPDVVDAQNDFADRFEIEKAAYRFMKAKRQDQVDQNHDFQPVVGAYIAESWIVKADDPWFPMPGAWAVGIKVEDPAVWAALKSGDLQGLSMAGGAVREEVTKGAADAVLVGLVQTLSQQVQALSKQVSDLTGLPALVKGVNERLGVVEKQRLSVSGQATGAAGKPFAQIL